MSYRMDFFAGTYEKVIAALEAGTVRYPSYVFVRDEDVESSTGRLAFCDQGSVLRFIEGENKQQVVVLDELPEVTDGDKEVIYIVGKMAYTFDGEAFNPLGFDNTEALSALEEKIANVEKEVSAIPSLYEKKAYEVSNKPVGTLVDYRDKEIRIMCPNDTEWTLQNSGAGSDANKYYIGFKAYAPSDDVVNFKEDLADKIADETLYSFEGNDFAGVDEFGRKYSIVWLPVAVYDEASATWTYHGAKSNAEKYVGWYYSVEWYNADGIVVASDCIKINLSNEECHTFIEPYYMAQLETMAAEIASLQSKVEDLEESTLTFVELE